MFYKKKVTILFTSHTILLTLLRTASLPDSIFIRVFFTVCLISAEMLDGPFATWILSLSFVTDTGLLNTDYINTLHLLIVSMFTGFANDFSSSWSTFLFFTFCVRLIKLSVALFNDPHFALSVTKSGLIRMFSSGGLISGILFVTLFHFLGVDAKCSLLYTGGCFNPIYCFPLFLCRSHFSEWLA